MEMVGGPVGVIAIAVVAALAILFAVLHFGFHVFRRRKGKSRDKSNVLNESRVEVLETTIIDAERRLVLIRCDRIEHLIMIGGPADLVVENDVRKVRSPGAPPAKVPGIETEKRVAPPPQRAVPPAVSPPETAIAPAPKAPEPSRPAPRSIAEARPASPPSRILPPIQPASGRNGTRSGDAPAAVPPLRADDVRSPVQRPQPIDPKSARRDAPPLRRTPQSSPAPISRGSELRATPAPPANDRSARPGKAGARTEPSPALPAAQIPWSDPDSIENEIVRALRFDPHTRGDQTPGRGDVPPAKAVTDSNTTLGDLADRLEEALAREVQSARQPQRAEPRLDDFRFDNGANSGGSEPARPAPQKERQDKRERPEPARANAIGSAPESEAKREQPQPGERREEAPVISLNSRRRETADQLEDEMARLLGELTSDTKGR